MSIEATETSYEDYEDVEDYHEGYDDALAGQSNRRWSAAYEHGYYDAKTKKPRAPQV